MTDSQNETGASLAEGGEQYLISRKAAIEALALRVEAAKEQEKIWPDDYQWNAGWKARRRGVEDSIAILESLAAPSRAPEQKTDDLVAEQKEPK